MGEPSYAQWQRKIHIWCNIDQSQGDFSHSHDGAYKLFHFVHARLVWNGVFNVDPYIIAFSSIYSNINGLFFIM